MSNTLFMLKDNLNLCHTCISLHCDGIPITDIQTAAQKLQINVGEALPIKPSADDNVVLPKSKKQKKKRHKKKK